MGRIRVRVLVATALAGFAAAWPTYVHVWQQGGGEAVWWRTEQVRQRFVRPRFDVTRAPGTVRVLLALGPRSSTGYGIEIVRVEEQRGRVLVVARDRSPRLGDSVEPRVTYPAAVVVFRNRDKAVAVEWR